MTATTLEEREAIRASVRSLMADRSSELAVREVMETAEGYDPAVWRQLVDIGVVGLVIAPEFGGAGLGPVELEAVMEEAGAALLCSPLLSSGVLAAQLLNACGDAAAQARLLPGIADGTRIATVAVTGECGTWTPDGVAVTASGTTEQVLLTGVSSFVTHGQNADVILVVARTADGFGVFETRPDAAGLMVEALPTFDRTLRLAKLTFDGTPAQRIGTAGWPAVEEALRWGLVALAGEQVGGARRIFDMTLEYIKNRVQFGRSVGGFQALKHMAADLLLEVESATSAAHHAAEQLAVAPGEAQEAINLAAFTCADAFTTTATTAVQMHGGIAFTWAHPAHLYLRRARGQAQLFGHPNVYRDRYLTTLGA